MDYVTPAVTTSSNLATSESHISHATTLQSFCRSLARHGSVDTLLHTINERMNDGLVRRHSLKTIGLDQWRIARYDVIEPIHTCNTVNHKNVPLCFQF